MIPKKIHYCWFGGKNHPEIMKYCMETWKKYMPDFEIIEWNEKTFDISSNQFVKEAYDSKKFAFVSDYVRLYALYTQGGIYLDTDVEVVKPLTPFLSHKAFTGGEDINSCITGTMGAEKGHPWIGKLLEYYLDKSFFDPNGKLPNTVIITQIINEMYGFKDSSEYKNFKNEIHIYPFEYFCAKEFDSGVITKTQNTYTIHHFNGSWLTKNEKKRHKNILRIKNFLGTIIGNKNVDRLIILKKKLFR